jgi:hypothetical protein
MSRFPRGSLPPGSFPAVATIAPHAMTKPAPAPVVEPVARVDLTTTCPTCMVEMKPEHAHYKCPSCGYRDSSSF